MGWFGRKKERSPTCEEVARRAIALRQVVTYALGILPRDEVRGAHSLPPEQLAEFRAATQQLRDRFWAEMGPYRDALTPWERGFAETTLLDMSERQQVDAGWRLESLQVLLWAVGAIERLPEWNQGADHRLAEPCLAKLGSRFIAQCSLRPRKELEAARDIAELWHWRSRTRQLVDSGQTFDASPELAKAGLVSFDAIVRFTAKKLKASGELAQIVDEDFAVGDKAYRDLSAEEFAKVTSITVERHCALNWLCGRAPGNRWDETPTGT